MFIFSDGDDAIEIFIPKHGVDNELQAMFAQYAVSVPTYWIDDDAQKDPSYMISHLT